MASGQQKAFCIIEFNKTESVIMMQRAFKRHYGTDPPLGINIRHWYQQFQETWCLYKEECPGRSHTSEKKVQWIQEGLQRSPSKSIRGASRELTIPRYWRVLWQRFRLKSYRLILVQDLRGGDKKKCLWWTTWRTTPSCKGWFLVMKQPFA